MGALAMPWATRLLTVAGAAQVRFVRVGLALLLPVELQRMNCTASTNRLLFYICNHGLKPLRSNITLPHFVHGAWPIGKPFVFVGIPHFAAAILKLDRSLTHETLGQLFASTAIESLFGTVECRVIPACCAQRPREPQRGLA